MTNIKETTPAELAHYQDEARKFAEKLKVQGRNFVGVDKPLIFVTDEMTKGKYEQKFFPVDSDTAIEAIANYMMENGKNADQMISEMSNQETD